MNVRASLPPLPIDRLSIRRHRRRLHRTQHALARDHLTVGFIGGSITAGWENTWANSVLGWFAAERPSAIIAGENAAIGATGSDSGCIRADREIIQRGCDLVFVEYAANDISRDRDRRRRTQEGLLRKLLAAGRDVVFVYSYCQEMYADMAEGRMPEIIEELEAFADHYNIGSVWAGLHALNDVRAGRMRWEEWLPDCLHPSHRGSWSYADAVIGYLQEELPRRAPDGVIPALPAPLHAANWQSARELPLNVARTKGPWLLKRVHGTSHVERVWETHAPGATLEFDFDGHGLILIFDYGKRSSEFCYRIDGGAWTPVVRERPSWSGDRGMVRALVIAEELSEGPHLFEMQVTHGNRPECSGTECRLAQISVL